METGTPARPFARSAPLVASGLVLLGVGYVTYQAGLMVYLGGFRSARFPILQDGALAEAALILGALMCLAGFTGLVVGAFRLATNMDAAVQALGHAPDPSSVRDVTPV